MPVIANGTTSYGETSRRSYIATGIFTTYFYSYTNSRNGNNQLVYTLAQNPSATDAQCKAGHILKENGRKIIYGVHNIDTNTTTTLTTSGNRPYYLVGVFDSSSMLSGFIDPNSPLFAPYSTNTPNFIERSSTNVTAPDGSTNDMGAPVFTSGSVTASGNITTSGILIQSKPIVALTTVANQTLVATLTGNSCLNSIITHSPSGTATITLPSTSAFIAVLGTTVGVAFEFTYINTTAFTATLSAGDLNTTFFGSAATPAVTNTTARFLVRLQTASTVVIYRIS